MNTLQTISPSRAAELVRKGAVLIDIHAEYAREHIPGSAPSRAEPHRQRYTGARR